MNQQRKLEILAAADFSGWRTHERATRLGQSIEDTNGFGIVLWGMSGAASRLAGGHQSEESLQLLLRGYAVLAAYYATIPWHEMDPHDPDFKFLFDYREKLNELGRKVELFATRTRENGMKASAEWPVYQDLDGMLGELMRTDYRAEVLERHGMRFSEPAP